jgi:PPOX class probable F420-dependent enzyme
VAKGALTRIENRFYKALRHPDAHSVALASPAGHLDELRRHNYCLLVTYRRSGAAVPTPVWFGIADGKVLVVTDVDSVKIKRIRANPRVRVAPSSLRGKPLGPPLEGEARVLPPAEREIGERAIAAHYGLARRIFEGTLGANGLRRARAAYIEVTPLGGEPRNTP